MGHVLTENRHGLIVDAEVSQANIANEWDSGVSLVARQSTHPGQTVGAYRGYDTLEFVEGCRELKVTPHVPTRTVNSCIDGRTTSSPGYDISQKKRKCIEECFGWMKTFGLMHKLRHRGIERVDWLFRFTAAAYNITRLKNLRV